VSFSPESRRKPIETRDAAVFETGTTVTIRGFELRYACATLVWCAIILWVSITPNPPGREFFLLPMADKIVHFCGYALLCWLASMSLRKAGRPYRIETLIIVPLVFSILFGILNELIQMTVEARSDELADVVADALGAVVVQAGFLCRRRRISEV